MKKKKIKKLYVFANFILLSVLMVQKLKYDIKFSDVTQ